jgi:hypothetical protein
MPKKPSRGKGKSRESRPKKLILEIELDTETVPMKPPFFRGTWIAKGKPQKRRK